MQTMLKFGVAYIHYTYIHTYTCVHAYIPTFKHYIHEYVYTHITPIYTCIVTKHEYIIFVQICITINTIHTTYINAYILHTY